jgi:hypothetical protein
MQVEGDTEEGKRKHERNFLGETRDQQKQSCCDVSRPDYEPEARTVSVSCKPIGNPRREQNAAAQCRENES